MRRTSFLLLVAAMAVACTDTTPAVYVASPSASTSPSPSRTPARSAVLASPSPSASPEPSLAPIKASTLTVSWKAADVTGIGGVSNLVGVARSRGTYVLIAELPYGDEEAGFAAWSSEDGEVWQLAQEFPKTERLMAVVAGGPGFVTSGADQAAGGTAVWTSVDGHTWLEVDDTSLNESVITTLVPTASGIVAFGWHQDAEATTMWTSPDGLEWLAPTNETGGIVAHGLQAVGSYDGRAIAFVDEQDEGKKSGLGIWETTGRAEWTRTGTLKGATSMAKVAGGDRGWVALDGKMAWTSPDGRTWSKGVPGPDVTADLAVDPSGFIAVGFVGSLPGDTCGDQRPFAGHTWTSSDGRVWKRMPVRKEFKTAMVTRLLVVDRTLIGFGQRLAESSDEMPVARWTAALPEISRSAKASDEASVFKSCGG
jgi:hypothetical protein